MKTFLAVSNIDNGQLRAAYNSDMGTINQIWNRLLIYPPDLNDKMSFKNLNFVF